MTNPDNVGGLPELPKGDVAFREDCLSKWQYAHSDEQMRAYGELCRAAPAGAETGNPVSEQNQLDSAHAGSGEVEELRATAWSNWEFIEHVTNWIIERGLLEITHEGGSLEAAKNITDSLDRALLRKLQQGAESNG